MHSSLAVSLAILQLVKVLVNCSSLFLNVYKIHIPAPLSASREAEQICPLSEHLTMPIKYRKKMMIILFHLLFGSKRGISEIGPSAIHAYV